MLVVNRLMPRKQRPPTSELRQAFIDAALTLIEERGVEGFSLREAARQVGVDPAMTYRYFEDRADLIATVARSGFAQMAGDMERALHHARTAGPEEKLKALGRSYLNFALKRQAQFKAMFGKNGLGARGPTVRGTGEKSQTPYEMMSDVLDELRVAGLLAFPVDQAALECWAAMHGAAMLLSDEALRGR